MSFSLDFFSGFFLDLVAAGPGAGAGSFFVTTSCSATSMISSFTWDKQIITFAVGDQFDWRNEKNERTSDLKILVI